MHLSCLITSNNELGNAGSNKIVSKWYYEVAPEESQYGSIKCELGKYYKNGVYLVFVYADNTAARDGLMEPVVLYRQCPIHPKSQWKAHTRNLALHLWIQNHHKIKIESSEVLFHVLEGPESDRGIGCRANDVLPQTRLGDLILTVLHFDIREIITQMW